MHRTTLSLALALAAFLANPVAADVQADILFRNASSSWVRFYVDGSLACSANPGDQCSTTVAPGTHALKAVNEDDATARHTADVPADGFTWTITD